MKEIKDTRMSEFITKYKNIKSFTLYKRFFLKIYSANMIQRLLYLNFQHKIIYKVQ